MRIVNLLKLKIFRLQKLIEQLQRRTKNQHLFLLWHFTELKLSQETSNKFFAEYLSQIGEAAL
jgi:hypothetical protein